jgi:hypothetical protein
VVCFEEKWAERLSLRLFAAHAEFCENVGLGSGPKQFNPKGMMSAFGALQALATNMLQRNHFLSTPVCSESQRFDTSP